MTPPPDGVEWLIDLTGCSATALQDQERLAALFDTLVAVMNLNPIGRPVWYRFPITNGLTGFWLLKESHLAMHTFPEYGSACLNVFCCVRRNPADWQALITDCLSGGVVQVREVARSYASV